MKDPKTLHQQDTETFDALLDVAIETHYEEQAFFEDEDREDFYLDAIELCAFEGIEFPKEEA